MPTKHFRIEGKVQGVFYRASARKKALSLGLTGWVRNTPGGQVELIAAGTEAQLQALQEWCCHGPDQAAVSRVIATDLPDQDFDGFSILR